MQYKNDSKDVTSTSNGVKPELDMGFKMRYSQVKYESDGVRHQTQRQTMPNLLELVKIEDSSRYFFAGLRDSSSWSESDFTIPIGLTRKGSLTT